MANAKKDANSIPTALALSQTDGKTPLQLKGNSANSTLKVIDAATGTDQGGTYAVKDQNQEPVMMATSSVDGTPVALYADPATGALLIKST